MHWTGRSLMNGSEGKPGRGVLRGIAAGVLAVATVAVVTAAKAPAPPGGTWTLVKVPLPANADHTYAELSSVACASSVCAAVGSYTGSAGSRGLVLTRLKARTGWKAVQAPVPAGAARNPFAVLSAVACGSAARCAAIGAYYLRSGQQQAMLLTGLGSSWTAVKAPVPAGGRRVTVDAVACGSASFCVAGGSYVDSSGEMQGLLLTWSGRSWTAAKAPLPATPFQDPTGSITNVTCPSARACVATGSYVDTEQNQQGMLLTGAGSSWTVVRSPVAGLIPGPVACISSSRCVAAARIEERSMLVTGSGKSWRATSPPLPPNTISERLSGLSSIACGPSACVTDGTYDAKVGSQVEGEALLLTGSGMSWKAAQAPVPPNARMDGSPSLSQVACPSASPCLAAGAYEVAAGYQRGLLESGTGSSWKATSAPQPAGATPSIYSQPSGLACASGSTCFDVSSYAQLSGNIQPLILTGPS